METPFEEKTPGELARQLMERSAEYGTLSDELGRIYAIKPVDWSMLRDQVTSDKQADREWEKTKTGYRETLIKMRMKVIDKEMSAIKKYLEVKEKELRGYL